MDEINFNFLAFPRVLLKMLHRDESYMLLHIMSFPPENGCFYSTKKWQEILGIGAIAFERAKNKLAFLNLIEISQGQSTGKHKNPPNVYRFNYNVGTWKVPIAIAKELTKRHEHIVFSESHFEDMDDFINQFNNAFPSLKSERQGRHKHKNAASAVQAPPKIQNPIQAPTPFQAFQSLENLAPPVEQTPKKHDFQKRAATLIKLNTRLLAYEYECFRDAVDLLHETDEHGFDENKIHFLETLYDLYTEKRTNGTDEEKKIIAAEEERNRPSED